MMEKKGNELMIHINWSVFQLKNPKTTEAFETLCYFLFCRRYNLTEGIRIDFNQAGLETEPIKNEQGEYCGFQSKYFEKKVSYDSIAGSIDQAIKHYPELKRIIIYINQNAKTSCDSAQKIEKKCATKGITIEWFLPGNFLISLNQPQNWDLAEFYFGETDTIKWLSNSKNIRINTLLQSKEFVELNLYHIDEVLSIKEYSKKILVSDKKLHLFSGAAGTGKSVCMWKLFNSYSGFDKVSKEQQLEVVNRIGAICIFINLNNTALDSLESIILSHKRFYSADNEHNKFIYLLDGLDEVPSSSITATILFLEELLEKDTTKKVVISCRVSSTNKFILKASFDNFTEYTIEDLSKKQVWAYFQNKRNTVKEKRLVELCRRDEKVLENVTDILTLNLLWTHILQISDINFLPELMELGVSTVLKDIHHKKYLEEINLPNPKEEAIININKELALYLFEKDKFCFTQRELYDIIDRTYPKCDYMSANRIVSFLTDNFFDITLNDNIYTFSYRHRRYAEYFTLLCIEDEIETNLDYLRQRNIIINKDLFDKMLMPYLYGKAKKNKDLSIACEVGLFNVYMGNDKAWGVDNAFYYWSTWIIYALASLPEKIFQIVIEDEGLPIKNFFFDIPEKLIELLKNNEKFYYSADFKQYYINYMLLIVVMHKFNKKDILPALLSKYTEIRKLCREKNYFFNSTSNRDNYMVWESILYIETVICKDNIDKYIEICINTSKEKNIDTIFKEYIETEIFLCASLYYNLLLYYPEKCVNMVEQMNFNQLSVFALVVSRVECVGTVLNNNNLKDVLISKFEKEIDNGGLSATLCLALKERIGASLTEKEVLLVTDYLQNNQFSSHSIFWKEHGDVVGFIFSTFIEKIGFTQLENPVKQYVIVYGEYIKLLTGILSIKGFVSKIKNYLERNSEATYYIRILLGKALALCNEDFLSIKGIMDYLSYKVRNSSLLIVYHKMKQYNQERFNEVMNVSLLNNLNSPEVYQDIDYTSSSDLLFMLSFILSSFSDNECYQYLLKGLGNGMLRMNERKDTIGDYRLLESMEELLKRNWLTTEEIISYLDRIILIANKMNKFHIDNDVHGQVMEILQKYNFEMAEYYYKRILPEETYNDIHFKFALGLIDRGRNIEFVEQCLENIRDSYDNFYQKFSHSSFYYRICVYLYMATCDFYSTDLKNTYFKKACEEIDALENAGWDRELANTEYQIYEKLCYEHQKEVDVSKQKEWDYKQNDVKHREDYLKILSGINSVEELKLFITKMQREYLVDNYQIGEILIQKSVDLIGNIDDILKLLSEQYYPSSSVGYTNSRNYWMVMVAALRNQKSRSSAFNYLISHGGGHDGFSELIKIYSELNNKDICLKLFDTMVRCIEFLLC